MKSCKRNKTVKLRRRRVFRHEVNHCSPPVSHIQYYMFVIVATEDREYTNYERLKVSSMYPCNSHNEFSSIRQLIFVH
uniref:Uncharacterized protein n=1 Tax=Trichogramma kaykai TaxID=54128 RepID=A0ABD2W8E9_9HYME